MPVIREVIVTTIDRSASRILRRWANRGRRRLDHCALPPLNDARTIF